MSSLFQYQCPNCGGYKTKHSQTQREKQLPADASKQLRALTAPRDLMFLLGFAFAALGLLLLNTNTIQVWGSPLLLVPITLFVLAFILLVAAIYYGIRASVFRTNAIDAAPAVDQTHFFSCELCGYNWIWTGKGLPPHNTGAPAHPDAARLGALALEEERKRQAAAAAAAAAYEEQRRRQR